MFFILSKILAFILSPLIWIIGIFLFALFTKKAGRKRKLYLSGIILLLFFSNAFILDEFARSWEVPAKTYEELGKYDVGIVLGGVLSFDEALRRVQFFRGNDRVMQALELYHKGYINKILFVGGSGSIRYAHIKEGPILKKYLLEIGFPEKDLLVEIQSKNTHENAAFSKPILDSLGSKELLLITSASHMRRARACFEKQDLLVATYSVDRHSGPRKLDLEHLLLPDPKALPAWDQFIHEWVGYLIYKMMGYA